LLPAHSSPVLVSRLNAALFGGAEAIFVMRR
jgi:hypothetical protein